MYFDKEGLQGISDSIQPSVTDEGAYAPNALFECALTNMYSFSFLKTLYNALLKKGEPYTAPCTLIYDWINQKNRNITL